MNCPYVDNSYKWAGGGFLSTVGDLLLFGNALLYSYQMAELKNTDGLLPGFLKPHTAKAIWAPVDKTEASWDKDGLYAQGWLVVEKQQKYGQCRSRRHYVSHTGGAVGASSVLLVLPSESAHTPPQGVVVTIITNMQSVGLNTTALKIAQEFDKARDEERASAWFINTLLWSFCSHFKRFVVNIKTLLCLQCWGVFMSSVLIQHLCQALDLIALYIIRNCLICWRNKNVLWKPLWGSLAS